MIVRGKQYYTRKIDTSLVETLDTFQIEVIRRLIKNDTIRIL